MAVSCSAPHLPTVHTRRWGSSRCDALAYRFASPLSFLPHVRDRVNKMDEFNGRPPSSSSSSDFYNTASPKPNSARPASAASSKMAPGLPLTASRVQHVESDDDDDSSEMDMDMSPASSRAATPDSPLQQMTLAGTKRKLSDPVHGANGSRSATVDASKKARLSALPAQDITTSPPGPAGLPAEIWQQVFLYLPPAMLCRSLRVCRDFHFYLTSTKAAPVARKGQTKVRLLDSETIWTQARKTYFPGLPRPLRRCTELEMLQLIGGQTCQFCNRVPIPSHATTPFNCGPGPDGLRVIWPFGIRACGRCLENNTLKVCRYVGGRGQLQLIFGRTSKSSNPTHLPSTAVSLMHFSRQTCTLFQRFNAKTRVASLPTCV